MNADEMVDSYVSNVVKRLPRRQRPTWRGNCDALLGEELAGEPGSDPTPERARDLLLTLGGRPTSPPGTARR